MQNGAACLMKPGEVRLRWVLGALLLAAAALALPLASEYRIALGLLGLATLYTAWKRC
jgi:hypothetical protein